MKADELIQLLEACPQRVASWLAGIGSRSFRDRHGVPRNEDGSYNLRAVHKHFVTTAQDEALGVLQDVPETDELRRWRAAKAAAAELDYAERLKELESRSAVIAAMERCLGVLKAWADRIGHDHPSVLRTYRQAIRHASMEAAAFVRPAGCRRILRIVPDDGDAFEVDLGHVPDEPVVLPDIEEHEVRVCPNCKGDLSASWRVSPDGTEEPRWFCHSVNCRTNWGGIPRKVPDGDQEGTP